MNEIVVALKAFLVNAGRVLIVKRSEEDVSGPGMWELPGGKLEFGETLEASLVREVKEECGCDVRVHELLYAAIVTTHPTREVVILAYRCSTSDTVVVLSREHTDFRWASYEELESYLPASILSDLRRSGLMTLHPRE